MKKYGLIGYPLTHSFSEKYFQKKFAEEGIADCTYENFSIKNIEEFIPLLSAHPDIQGLNVTIPYKEEVIALLDSLHPEAAAIGAVNCIKMEAEKRIGFNTDALGFEKSIKPFLENKYERALILGTGGASKSVAYVLKKWGIPFHFVSREKQASNCITYQELHKETMKHFQLIVNTTPLGTFPDVDTFPPIPYDGIGEAHFLYDTVYNPAETVFLKLGKERGASVMNGLKMLELQAEASWRIWNDNMN